MDQDTELHEKRIAAGTLASLTQADLSTVVALLNPELAEKDSVVSTVEGGPLDLFFAQLSAMEMAEEPSSGEGKSWALTDKGRQVLPTLFQALTAGYPPPGSLITEEAIAILKLNAKDGRGQAMGKLGVLYDSGVGVKEDVAEAVKWYKKGMEAGNRLSLNNMGVMYFAGRGVEKDPGKAAECFEKAAEKGAVIAMEGLAFLYSDGVEEHPTDLAVSTEWFRRAAEQGHAISACNYALALEEGKGVEADPVAALMWYDLGIGAGVDAQKNREALAAKMSPEQIDEAERRKQAFVEDAKKRMAG